MRNLYLISYCSTSTEANTELINELYDFFRSFDNLSSPDIRRTINNTFIISTDTSLDLQEVQILKALSGILKSSDNVLVCKLDDSATAIGKDYENLKGIINFEEGMKIQKPH
jgi:archaeosine-15-forming tRNA-guanine transglycosylase